MRERGATLKLNVVRMRSNCHRPIRLLIHEPSVDVRQDKSNSVVVVATVVGGAEVVDDVLEVELVGAAVVVVLWLSHVSPGGRYCWQLIYTE